MKTNRYLPDTNRISVLTATVLLAFALTRLLSGSAYRLGFQVFGRIIHFDFDLRLVVIILASGLTATGMDWLLRDHPLLEKKPTVEHWLVPTLTALVLGVPLYLLPGGSLWWGGFGLGGLLLVLVFWAEYVVVSPGDTSYPTAMVVLTVISFSLYLILTLALRYSNTRLFLLTPPLFLATFFVSLRTLHLRVGGRWELAWSAGIAIIGIQLAAGLHYLPISPIRYGIFLLGTLYTLTSLIASLLEGIPLRRALTEPLVMLLLVWVAGILLG
ncbi:MAG: hypothetical protein HN736_06395 [Anaerolineae bacterium]|jgi:hypothetical protein|nr:hypothetical protein [Anaerolineae bacterium]MBT3713832.1 hypothetical protein [Anaerolineae bacterium]MBT4309391.1 hypothetical protein [Anaerolineae bacterium]MBT4459201.1 hypothetical protein [Anaerolineae bacterium]MBT4840816.1 hypothetical protein [Anaerolineae bacterium]